MTNVSDMGDFLDIGPLRSLVAVAERGGFLRAASSLHLSQAAVSQHVRRLEATVGKPVVERHGRGSRLTPVGERLLEHARTILAAHDGALLDLDVVSTVTVSVGSTEHAAAQLLPLLSERLTDVDPAWKFLFRLDRGQVLRQGVASGRLDLALLLGAPDGASDLYVGDLDLTWFSSPGWQRPEPGGPVPLVAFDNPCVLRSRALETLAANRVPAVIGAEAVQLAGVQAAVGAGLGVALMATLGEVPAGLTPRHDLPVAAPLPLCLRARTGLDPRLMEVAAAALAEVLSSQGSAARGA